jgi:hypothetical protein
LDQIMRDNKRIETMCDPRGAIMVKKRSREDRTRCSLFSR